LLVESPFASDAYHGSDIGSEICGKIVTPIPPKNDRGVFTKRNPKRIAASLKRSAERSRRRKADPYRSALSMLTFYINRAGKNLPASRRRVLQRAKGELRKQFGRD
jgi:Protein of unknown function (DUF3175)